MKPLYTTLLALALTLDLTLHLALTTAAAQDLTNAGSTITVLPGATLYVGTGGLTNQAGGTLTNAGTLRVDGPLLSAGSLDLSSGTLEVRGDFTNTGTLTPGTSPVTFSGAANQLLAPGGATLYQVLVSKTTAGANTLRLAGNLTISNLLSLTSGFVHTKNGTTLSTVRLPNGATLSGEAPGRYVLGAIEVTRTAVSGAAVDFGHGAVLDPTSNALGTVSITRVAGLTTADASYGQNLGGTTQGIDRIWTVTAATQPSAAVQLTLSWPTDNDNGLTGFAQARLWQQAATGQPWAAVGPSTNASSRSISGSPTALGRFTVSNAANPLPVTLTDFTAQADGPAAVRLRWTTASELNNAGFTVERSLDARSFAPIGSMAGAGTSPLPHSYTLRDAQLPTGATLLYYRLRQEDTNGTATYSPVRAVSFTPSLLHSFTVWPNPARSACTVQGAGEGAAVQLLDALGRTVASAQADADGQAHLALPAGLATGVYVVRCGAQALRLTVE